jgi:hypothetical protein
MRSRALTVLSSYLDRELANEVSNIHKNTNYSLRQTSLRIHGFVADPEATFWDNRNRILGEMNTYKYFSKPTKISFHDLCQYSKPPQGIQNLLGLGLKYCLETPRPWQDLRKSMYQFQHSVRLHFFFKNKAETDSDAESVSSDPDRNV